MSSVGGSTHQPYEAFLVDASTGPKTDPIRVEIHAYKETDWANVGLLTRFVARILGRVTDATIDGKVYVVVNSIYDPISHQRNQGINSMLVSTALNSLISRKPVQETGVPLPETLPDDRPATVPEPSKVPPAREATKGPVSLKDELKAMEFNVFNKSLAGCTHQFREFLAQPQYEGHQLKKEEATVMMERIKLGGSDVEGTVKFKSEGQVLEGMMGSDHKPDIVAQQFYIKLMTAAGIQVPRQWKNV